MELNKESDFYGKEKISKILFKIAPPVMIAQLIQALYNIVDSLFIGHYSDSGLNALSIVYPLQLLMIALGVGTGVGVNTIMAYQYGHGNQENAKKYAGAGTILVGIIWLIFTALTWFILPIYAKSQTSSSLVVADVISYGRIICIFGFGLFFESVWTKVCQADGDMKTPMIAQICGAITNIVLDPILIFGFLFIPEMGIIGAAVASVIGQIVAALIVFKKGFRKFYNHNFLDYSKQILHYGLPNILMQSAYTFYIFGLNMILATFSNEAVTALGLYYKWQTIFFIPLGAMQVCIVPIISFNFATKNIKRCKDTLNLSILFGVLMMLIGTLFFECIPNQMLRVFSSNEEVIKIGANGFRYIGFSFIPLVTSLIYPVFFQAIGYSFKSSFLTILRTVILFVPLGYLFSLISLDVFWLTYIVTETITTIVGFIFYQQFIKKF